MTTALSPKVSPSVVRREQIGEALGDLEMVFFDPGCLGDCSVEDAAATLGGEFVGSHRDDEILRRLGELVAADQAGQLKVAGRHLRAVRRKLAERWGITPLVAEPLVPDVEAKRLASLARSGAGKAQVALCQDRPGSSRRTAEGKWHRGHDKRACNKSHEFEPTVITGGR